MKTYCGMEVLVDIVLRNVSPSCVIIILQFLFPFVYRLMHLNCSICYSFLPENLDSFVVQKKKHVPVFIELNKHIKACLLIFRVSSEAWIR